MTQTLQSTPERGTRAGSDGAKRTKKGSNVPVAVDPLGSLLALHVTPAKEQDRAQGDRLAQAVQAATGQREELASVDQGSTGEQPAAAVGSRASRWRWSSIPRAPVAWCSCPGARWWSARLLGRAASATSCGTTSA